MTRRGSKRAPARRALALLAAAGCAHGAPLPADHPADPRAPIGRLVDPSPSLAPGVVTYAEPARVTEPAAPTLPADHAGHPVPADHAGHPMPAADPKPRAATPAEPAHHHHP